jgi:lipoyl(octanoyl) transferase
MQRARLIIDPPSTGSWNMAVDQAILETADETGLVTLRFYQWSQPTLSLGYFQKQAERDCHPPSQACPLVRRRTGGGAIVHDTELTYSLCVPSTNRWSSKNEELYDAIHKIIIGLLKEDGIVTTLYRDASAESEIENGLLRVNSNQNSPSPVDPNAFLCFGRRSPGDVVFNGHKIVGSAQRRLKNSLLQHGSVLYGKSSFAPELCGINDISGSKYTFEDLASRLLPSIEDYLSTNMIRQDLTEMENSAAKRVENSHFRNPRWLNRS